MNGAWCWSLLCCFDQKFLQLLLLLLFAEQLNKLFASPPVKPMTMTMRMWLTITMKLTMKMMKMTTSIWVIQLTDQIGGEAIFGHPWTSPGKGQNQPRYSCPRILSGAYDQKLYSLWKTQNTAHWTFPWAEYKVSPHSSTLCQDHEVLLLYIPLHPQRSPATYQTGSSIDLYLETLRATWLRDVFTFCWQQPLPSLVRDALQFQIVCSF